jgi:hypothetical protein
MNKPESLSTRDSAARRRAALRAQGLRPKQVWVLDLRDPDVRERVHTACQRISAAPHREEDLAIAEAVQYWPPDEPD